MTYTTAIYSSAGTQESVENPSACYKSIDPNNNAICTYTHPEANARWKCNFLSPISHSHYLHGLRENEERKAHDLAEFNRLWAMGKSGEKIDSPPQIRVTEMVVACAGGGYIPRGLKVEEGIR